MKLSVVTVRSFRGRLLPVVLVGAAFWAGACGSNVRKMIPTGVETFPQPDGRTAYIATARASEQAIASGSIARKQTTACDAARTLLENDWTDRALGRPNFSKAEFFLLEDAEYCRVRIIR